MQKLKKKTKKDFRVYFIILTFISILTSSCSASTSQYSASFPDLPNSFNENTFIQSSFYEESEFENKFNEVIYLENKITEFQINQKIIQPILLNEVFYNENIILESTEVHLFDSIQEAKAYQEQYLGSTVELDFAELEKEFEDTMKLIFVQVTAILAGAAVSFLYGGIAGTIPDAIEMSALIVGATLGALIISEYNSILSGSVGNSDETIKYDKMLGILEGLQLGLMFSAIVSIPFAVKALVSSLDNLYRSAQTFVRSFKQIDIKSAGSYVGTLYRGKIYKTPKVGDPQDVIGSMDIQKNLYYNDGTVIANISKFDLESVSSIDIPITNYDNIVGTYKNRKGNPKFDIVKNSDGSYTRRVYELNKGTGEYNIKSSHKMDKDGWEYTPDGKPLKKFDVESENYTVNFSKAQLNNLSIAKDGKIGLKSFYDESIRTYVFKDDKGNVIAFKRDNFLIKESLDPNERIVLGELYLDDGVFKIRPDWELRLESNYKTGLSEFRKNLIKVIVDKSVPDRLFTTPRKGKPIFYPEELEYTRRFGKLPDGIQIHHVKGRKNYPELVAETSNMEPVRTKLPNSLTEQQQKQLLRSSGCADGNFHKCEGHAGSYNNIARPTPNYINYKEVFPWVIIYTIY